MTVVSRRKFLTAAAAAAATAGYGILDEMKKNPPATVPTTNSEIRRQELRNTLKRPAATLGSNNQPPDEKPTENSEIRRQGLKKTLQPTANNEAEIIESWRNSKNPILQELAKNPPINLPLTSAGLKDFFYKQKEQELEELNKAAMLFSALGDSKLQDLLIELRQMEIELRQMEKPIYPAISLLKHDKLPGVYLVKPFNSHPYLFTPFPAEKYRLSVQENNFGNPEGGRLDPLTQRIALKLIEKYKDGHNFRDIDDTDFYGTTFYSSEHFKEEIPLNK